MLKNSRNLRNQTPRWRIPFIALVLALAIGSAGQIQPAQAAQDNPADIYFEVWAFPEKPPTLCVKQSYTFYVSVNKGIVKIINDKGYNIPRGSVTGGATITGSVSPSDIGTLNPEEVSVELAAGGSSPGQVAVVFTAKNPGAASLVFKASVNPAWVAGDPGELTSLGKSVPAKEARIPIKVINCKFKATTIGQWRVPGEAKTYISATSNDAEVKAADAQSPLTGSTSVNWVATIGRVRDCSGTISIGSSQINWNGSMDESGQLTLNGDYQSATASYDVECSGGGESTGGSMQIDLTPDPVQVSMASSGGSTRQTQVLQGPEAVSGSVIIIIVPEEDAAVALDTDHRSARSGSPSIWLARLWDDIPWTYRALLALR